MNVWWVLLAIAAGVLMVLVLSGAVHAQAGAPIPAYTTADPINPDRLGLAMPDGRYQIEFVDGCRDWLKDGINVDATLGGGQLVFLTPADSNSPICPAQVDQKMSDTPCFLNDIGACDVAMESDP